MTASDLRRVPAGAGHRVFRLLHDVLAIPRSELVSVERQSSNFSGVARIGKTYLTLILVVEPEFLCSQFFRLCLARDRGVDFQLLIGLALGIVVLNVGNALDGLAIRPNVRYPAGRILCSSLTE